MELMLWREQTVEMPWKYYKENLIIRTLLKILATLNLMEYYDLLPYDL
jgi:hypothetical protein